MSQMRDVIEDLKVNRYKVMNTSWAFAKSGLVVGIDRPTRMVITWNDGTTTEEVMHPAGIHGNYGFIVGMAVKV